MLYDARMPQPRACLRLAAIACCAIVASLSSQSARCEETSPQIWVNPGFYSQHFKSGGQFRGDNWGVGAEVTFSPDHSLLAGSFINSDDRRSKYGAYWWR